MKNNRLIKNLFSISVTSLLVFSNFFPILSIQAQTDPEITAPEAPVEEVIEEVVVQEIDQVLAEMAAPEEETAVPEEPVAEEPVEKPEVEKPVENPVAEEPEMAQLPETPNVIEPVDTVGEEPVVDEPSDTAGEPLPEKIENPITDPDPALEPIVEEVVAELTQELAAAPAPEPTAESPPAEEPVLEEPETLPAPELSTDKDKYYPGEIVTIFGNLFKSLQNLVLKIFGGSIETNDYVESYHDVTTDEQGSFEYQYQLDSVSRPVYTVEALDEDGVLVATTTFLDPTQISYDKGVYRTDQNKWTTGNAGSAYQEGDWVYYTYAINGLGPDNPTIPDFNVVFNHYQSATDAVFIDAFTNFQYCWDCAELPDGISNPGDLPAETEKDKWHTWNINPDKVNLEYDDSTHICDGTDLEGDGLAQFHCFKVDEPTDFDTTKPELSSGNHTLRIFYEAHLSRSYDWLAGEESELGPTGTREITAPTPVYGADVYSTWTGIYNGVGFASGSSRHFNLQDQTAGPSGAITLPIPTVQAPSGSITIVKDTVPDDPQDFNFSGDLGTFTLDDDADGTLPNSILFENLPPGTYNINEIPEAGWDLTDITCVSDGTPDYTPSSDNVSINLAEGENITCTFTNELQMGQIVVIKDAIPNDAQDFEFTNDFGQGYPNPFYLDDDADGTWPNTRTFDLIADTYYLWENIPAGWALDDVTCVSSLGHSETTPDLELDPGEVITCTFTNIKPDAKIAINPPSDSNAVGDPHLLTATVWEDAGYGFVLAAGETVTFTVTSGAATFVGGVDTCVTNVSGYCSVSIVSNTPGANTIKAVSDVSVLGLSLHRETDGLNGNSGEAAKTYVNARISIVPTDTNEVDDSHTFTVTVEENTGSGWVGVSGVYPTVTFSPSDPGTITDNCLSTGTNSSGQCTVVVNSTIAGVFTASASASFSVLGVPFSISTDGTGENSYPATKTYVDGRITLTPGTATNNVNSAHTITAHVYENNGSGESDASGVTVNFSLLNNTAGANFVGNDYCITGGGGTCTVQINSSVPGSVDIHGTATWTVNTVSITRATDSTHGSSGDANKVYQAGKIIVDKVTNPSSDSQLFTFTPSYNGGATFQLADLTTPNDSGWLAPGTYSVSENVPSGWDLTSATCDDGSLLSAINLSAGETITCTFTNTKRGSIAGKKFEDHNGDGLNNGSDHGLENWTITLSGAASATTQTDSNGNYSFTNLAPGTYHVCETLKTDWLQTSPTSGFSCTDGLGYTIVLSAGQNSTGNDFGNFRLASISGYKLNDLDGDGENDAEDLPLAGWVFDLEKYIVDEWVVVDTDTTDATGAWSFSGLTPGKYRVHENMQAGWIPTTYVSGYYPSAAGFDETSGSIIINVIFRNFEKGSIHGQKFEDLDGDGNPREAGEPYLENWTIHLYNTDETPWVLVATDVTDINGEYNFDNLAPGSYKVCEVLESGWTQTFPNIADNNSSPSYSEEGPKCQTVNIDSSGESNTKNFGNYENPKLTIIKHVINDNGGTAVAANFNLHVKDGGSDVASSPAAGSETGTQYTLYPGTFVASEDTPLAGYTNVTNDSNNGDCDGSGSVTLQSGDNKTCTITNDDDAPALYLKKHVINDNGGTAVAGDWTLSAGANDVTGSETAVLATDQAGTYALSETSVSGYTNTSITCDDDPGVPVTSVTIGLGETVTCTFVNDDDAPSLTLIKHVINDNGGTAVASDWTLYADTLSVTGSESGAVVTDQAGTYALSESSVSGYTNTSITCDNSTGEVTSVTVGLGEDVTCTFVNDDIAPTLKLVKTVTNDNGGTAVPDDWTLRARKLCAMGDTDPNCGFENAGGSGIFEPVLAGTAYTMFETGPAGYTAGDWSCDGGTQVGNKITLGLADEVTCTINNDDISPKLTIVKDADPNDCQDFEFNMTGESNFYLDDDYGVVGCLDTDQPQSKLFDDINANQDLTVTEVIPNSYWEYKSVTCVVTGTATPYPFTNTTNGLVINLGLEDEVTCTFLNEKESPTRTLGFWQTHTDYTSLIYDTYFYPLGGMLIGDGTAHVVGSGTGDRITNIKDTDSSELFGGFFANIAKTTNGKGKNAKRTPIDQARMQLLQQLIAAQLNCAAFGCQTSVHDLIDEANAAYAANDKNDILYYAGQLGAYNESGDTIIIVGDPGHATPKISKDWADIAFWDTP